MATSDSRFERVLTAAKQQLPGAFAHGGVLPYSDGMATLRRGEERTVNPEILEDLLPGANEDLRDFEEANTELGFDAFAFYVSFHKPTPDGRWGIFYWDSRIRQLAARMARDLLVAPQEARDLALEILRTHELFHFRLDVYALHQELTLMRPLYNSYSHSVYAKVHCTAECYEESLANRACVERSKWPKIKFFGHPLSLSLRKFIKDLCKQAPPGYRDFDRPPFHLKSGLGGQLFYTKATARITEPQAQWVGDAGPFGRRRVCPEYVLLNQSIKPSQGAPVVLRRGGHVWVFHRYDPDPWPSQPHGHDREDGHKLSLRDGKIYDSRNRQAIGQESRKLLLELRGLLKQKWPDVRLPDLDPHIEA